MKKYGTLVAIALLSVSLFASRVVAAETDGVMMKGGKMMMMKNGKAAGPMKHQMTTTNGHKVMPDGTMKMPDGTEMRMQEGQMMTMDGKMMDSAKGMMHGEGMKGGKDMKMEGMGK